MIYPSLNKSFSLYMLNVTQTPMSVMVLSKITGVLTGAAIQWELDTLISGKTCIF